MNLSWIGVANLIVKPIWFLFLVYTARTLGAEDFGRFTFSVSFVMMFAILYELGLELFTVKEVATKKQSSQKLLGNCLIIKLILAPIVSLFIIVIIHVLGYSGTTLFAVYWAIIYVFFTTTTNYLRTFFRGFEKINFEAYSMIIEKLILFVLGGFALISNAGVVNFLKLLTLGSFISLIGTAVILFNKLVKPDFTLDIKLILEILKKAWPFALMNIFMLIYFRIDVVMLSMMKNETIVGLYSSSYRIMEMLIMIPAAIMIPIYPAMSRLFRDDSNKFNKLSKNTTKLMLLFSLPVTLAVYIFAGQLMGVFYFDSEFLSAIPALKILAWVLPFSCLTFVFGTMLASTGRQIISTRNVGICAGLNILLNFIFIPQHGFIGASIATLVTEVVLVVLSVNALFGYVSQNIFRAFINYVQK